MPAANFVDTNVLIYILSGDVAKADRAEKLLLQGAVISVQVLNEFANVARRKIGMQWPELQETLAGIRRVCRVEPLTLDVHEAGLFLAERYGITVYDAMIVSSALAAGCPTLYSEDFQHGLRVEKKLTIRNPFH